MQTIVTCYYPLEKSKHTLQEYYSWLFNFLMYVDSNIVLFTWGDAAVKMIQSLRDKAGLSDRLVIIQKHYYEFRFSELDWNSQLAKTELPQLHTTDLFKIWANKSLFVEEAIRLNPFKSTLFAWCDAGCWRDTRIAAMCGNGWPVYEKVKPGRLHILAFEDMGPLLQVVKAKTDWTHEHVVTELKTPYKLLVGGTILIGDADAWKHWIPAFESTLKLFFANDLFAGDDQAVIASTALWLSASQGHQPVFFKVPTQEDAVLNGLQGDIWFIFQLYFSKHAFKLVTY